MVDRRAVARVCLVSVPRWAVVCSKYVGAEVRLRPPSGDAEDIAHELNGGLVMVAKGEYAQALACFDDIMELDPDNLTPMEALVQLHELKRLSEGGESS